VIRVVHEETPERAAAVAAALRERGASVAVATVAEPTGEAERYVALGERALATLAFADVAAPVVPVGLVPAGVPLEDPAAAAAVALAPDPDVVSQPILGVHDEQGERARAVFDVTLVTSEPARISEYAVVAGDRPVDGFRADGVVVATSLGSAGYASAVGGPVVEVPGALSVVPVSPFETQRDRWVLEPPVRLSVERDDSTVSLVADDRVVGEVGAGAPVTVSVAGTFPVVRSTPP
jgi:NAD+ kinase